MNYSANTVKKKVYAYIITMINERWHLLVFNHVNTPEAGTQVPGGSVEPGEDVTTAALREAKEETGLINLQLIEKLGIVMCDLAEYGLAEIHERHFFLLQCEDYPGDTWTAYEETPSDGSQGPIAFQFYWVDLDHVPTLSSGMDQMLSEVRLR